MSFSDPNGEDWLHEPRGASRGFRTPLLVPDLLSQQLPPAGEPAASAVPLTEVLL
jgi:hypothetical protein